MVRVVSEAREAPAMKEGCRAGPGNWPLHKA